MSNTRGPDIFEVCEAQAAEIATLRAELTEANSTAMHHLASIAELEGSVKMYLSDNATLRTRVETLEAALAKARVYLRIIKSKTDKRTDVVLEAIDAALAAKEPR